MKLSLFIVLFFIAQSSYAQNYFNVVTSKEEFNKIDSIVKESSSEATTLKVKKDKVFYTSIIKDLHQNLKIINSNKKKEDSILNSKYSFYNKKIASTRKSKKKKQYLKEIEYLDLERQNNNYKFRTEKQNVLRSIEENKKALYDAIKKEIQANKETSSIRAAKPPIKGKIIITSPFGNRTHPITGKEHFHNGIDIRAKYVNVYPILPGKVTKIDYSKELGIYIEVTHKNRLKSIYGHLSKILLLENTKVSQTTPIAITGDTGGSTAPHLHLVIKDGKNYINPNIIINDNI